MMSGFSILVWLEVSRLDDTGTVVPRQALKGLAGLIAIKLVSILTVVLEVN